MLRFVEAFKRHLNETEVVLEDGATARVLLLAAVPPAVLVHMPVVLAVTCRLQG